MGKRKNIRFRVSNDDTDHYTFSLWCRGTGLFHANGDTWSSHQATAIASIKLDVPRTNKHAVELDMEKLTQAPMTFRIVRTFGQKPKRHPDAPYAKPAFSRAALRRMEDKARSRIIQKIYAYHSGSLERPSADAAMVRPATQKEIDEEKRHKKSLCELCSTHPGGCGGALEVLQGIYIKIENHQKYEARRELLSHRMKQCRPGATLPRDCQVLYHQTDPETAEKIITTQEMKRGEGGLFGGGIYFATSPQSTNLKAHHHGAVLKCIVYLGKIKETHVSLPTMTFANLTTEGYDSVRGVSGPKFLSTGDEYVVYNKDQILRMEYVSSP